MIEIQTIEVSSQEGTTFKNLSVKKAKEEESKTRGKKRERNNLPRKTKCDPNFYLDF